MPVTLKYLSWTSADGAALRADVTVGDDYRADVTPRSSPPAATEAQPTCSTCGAPQVVTWGVRWLGTPWPKRHWRRLLGIDAPEDWRGCGCVLLLKVVWSEIGREWRNMRGRKLS